MKVWMQILHVEKWKHNTEKDALWLRTGWTYRLQKQYSLEIQI